MMIYAEEDHWPLKDTPCRIGACHGGPMPDIVVAPRDERSCATCERYMATRDATGRITDVDLGECIGLVSGFGRRQTKSGMVCARWSGIGTVDPEHDATAATEHLYDPSGTRKVI